MCSCSSLERGSKNEKMKSQYAQYGCGLCAPSDWRNFDTSPILRLQKLSLIGRRVWNLGNKPSPKNVESGDIVRRLPLPVGSCKAVHCSHVLEHLSLEEFRAALKNTRDYLEEGGVFRFALPDLKRLAKDYLASDSPAAAAVFMEETYLGKKTRTRGFNGFVRQWVGNSAHLWMWDYKGMAAELERAGFRQVRRAEFGDSADPHFAEVEERHRWQDCLGVECVR